MRQQRAFQDPAKGRTDVITIACLLGALDDLEATALITTAVLEWPRAQTARLLRCSEEEVQIAYESALMKVRPLENLVMAPNECSEGPLPISPELRTWARQNCEQAVRPCHHCEAPFLTRHLLAAHGGRPRRFCSNACRQAAYRTRRAAGPQMPLTIAPSTPDRQRVNNQFAVTCSSQYDRPRELGAGLFLRCLVFQGHEGPHRTLTGAPPGTRTELAWAVWEDPSSPVDWKRTCGRRTVDCSTVGGCDWSCIRRHGHIWCALPHGHSNMCLSIEHSSYPTGARPLDRNLEKALRQRLSAPQPRDEAIALASDKLLQPASEAHRVADA
ncbi:hypothetical protein [Streptomyces sp. NPDC005374]|uniref:hypothetical protein n=1 Tax=Streptomyces sp. NPDC005374 TaxID=3364713 RepID=UPI0036A9B676